MFDKMKQLYEMQKKARALQQQLQAIKVEKVSQDGELKIKVNGTQKIEAITIGPSWLSSEQKEKLEATLCQLLNDGMAAIQKETAAQAAELMKDLKGLNIPGL